jgi:hypothetical protein
MSSIGIFHLRLTWYVHFMSNGNYRYLNTLTQIMGPTVDVLSAHRKRQKAPHIPSPYQLQQLSRLSSIVSSSTLNTHLSQQNLSTRTSQYGVTRHIRATSRQSNASISANSQPPKRILSDDKLTMDDASKIYISDLSLKNSWPDKRTALSMAEEAALQANHHAKADGHDQIDSKSPSVLRTVCLSCISHVHVLTVYFQIRHAGSNWCSSLKTYIYDSLHLWGLVLMLEERKTMTLMEIQEYTKAAVADIIRGKKFLHTGLNATGVSQFTLVNCCLPLPI